MGDAAPVGPCGRLLYGTPIHGPPAGLPFCQRCGWPHAESHVEPEAAWLALVEGGLEVEAEGRGPLNKRRVAPGDGFEPEIPAQALDPIIPALLHSAGADPCHAYVPVVFY